jgi:hypothetical protein
VGIFYHAFKYESRIEIKTVQSSKVAGFHLAKEIPEVIHKVCRFSDEAIIDVKKAVSNAFRWLYIFLEKQQVPETLSVSDGSAGNCALLSPPYIFSLPNVRSLQIPQENCPSYPLLSVHSVFQTLLSSPSTFPPSLCPGFPMYTPRFPRFPGDTHI